jgi:K+-sensing histidine kinase KdpD
MDILKQGVISVLFKEYSPKRMKKELKEILYNFHFLEEVKELAENDAKTQKFLGVVKTLSSDNDINSIMVSILNSMKEVFQLETTIFFVAARDKLRQKIILGKDDKKLPKSEWDLKDRGIQWLKDIREKKKPIYITAKSEKFYKEYFKENTLLLPLVIKEKFLGLIAATFGSASGKLSKSEITLLTAFAEQTALALENAQLYWDVIKAREELVNQEKKTLLGQIALSLNHEINNPLSIISMEAQLLQKRMTKKESKVEARLANIENNIERIKVILETISSLDINGQMTEEYIDGRQMLNLYNGH